MSRWSPTYYREEPDGPGFLESALGSYVSEKEKAREFENEVRSKGGVILPRQPGKIESWVRGKAGSVWDRVYQGRRSPAAGLKVKDINQELEPNPHPTESSNPVRPPTWNINGGPNQPMRQPFVQDTRKDMRGRTPFDERGPRLPGGRTIPAPVSWNPEVDNPIAAAQGRTPVADRLDAQEPPIGPVTITGPHGQKAQFDPLRQAKIDIWKRRGELDEELEHKRRLYKEFPDAVPGSSAMDMEDRRELADLRHAQRLAEIEAAGKQSRDTKTTVPGKAPGSGSASSLTAEDRLELSVLTAELHSVERNIPTNPRDRMRAMRDPNEAARITAAEGKVRGIRQKIADLQRRGKPKPVVDPPKKKGKLVPSPGYRSRARQLEASGMPESQIRTTMTSEGWDHSTGQRRK